MKDEFLHQIMQKSGAAELPELLSKKLSGSALNSLLLETFHRKAGRLRPAEVLRAYAENRFVRPSTAPFLKLLNLRNDLLHKAAGAGFEPLNLSPVSPLGSCSAVGLAHQDKILSATRGVELVADATNVLALESALRRKQQSGSETIRLCAAHRHIRTQVFDFEGFTPHFDIFCMTSAGRDTGHFSFEREVLQEHLGLYFSLLKTLPDAGDLRVELTPFSKEAESFGRQMGTGLFDDQISFEILPVESEGYYRFMRCKIYMSLRGQDLDIGDSGFTDWTARLSSNRKERFFISGLGIELIAKLLA